MRDAINFAALLACVVIITLPSMIALDAAFAWLKRRRCAKPRHVHDCIYRID